MSFFLHDHIDIGLHNQGARVDAIDINLETPLHLACKRGDTAVAKLLLDAKAGAHVLHRKPTAQIFDDKHFLAKDYMQQGMRVSKVMQY